MASLLDSAIEKLEKSFGKGKGKKEKEKEKPEEEEGDGEGEEGEGGDGEEGDDELVDATSVLKSLDKRLEAMEDNYGTIVKALNAVLDQNGQEEDMQKAIGESLLLVAKNQAKLATTPQPRKSALSALEARLAKGGFSGSADNGASGDFNEMRGRLDKALAEKKININEYSMAETQLQKATINPAFQLDSWIAALLSA